MTAGIEQSIADHLEQESNDVEPEPEKEQIYDFSIYEEGHTKYSSNFGAPPPGPGQLGCFGFIVMYMVNRNHSRARQDKKSLISRNKVKTGFKQSARRLKERTRSMLSLASTNWRNSGIFSSNVNLSTRSRHNSAVDPCPSEFEGGAGASGRQRHMSMQDRVEMYNTVLEIEQEDKEQKPKTIQRKNSKVMFEPPQLEVTKETNKNDDEAAAKVEEVEAEVHQKISVQQAPRSRKVSKISIFEFVPEEAESK